MTDFSVRFGYEDLAADLRENDFPISLANGLWDITKMAHFTNIAKIDDYGNIRGLHADFRHKCNVIWFNFYKQSLDEIPSSPATALATIRQKFFKPPFHKQYAFIEFMANRFAGSDEGNLEYVQMCNSVLERERSAFRFAGKVLVKISNEVDRSEIEQSLKEGGPNGVREHIRKAAELYSATPPDYRNSIKESISAVESAVAHVAGKKTMGVSSGLKPLLDTLGIHPALMQGFEKIYSYTSDERGIRHSLFDDNKSTQADARYMLVACSAFSNYLIAKNIETS